MKQKAFVLQNKGMNRDFSISKAGESSAFENRNIRILARENETLLSVTNERGTKEVALGAAIHGELLGWNVLNNHIILFTHDAESASPDFIYRIDCIGEGEFIMVRGEYDPLNPDPEKYETDVPLYNGTLGFDLSCPIESVVYEESDGIGKIYWVDGKNVLRFANILEKLSVITDEQSGWNDTSFDSNRTASFGISATVKKDYSGNPRANGTVQYILTYFNKHGQETGYVWMSDLVYLAPAGRGGAADETNSCRITIQLSGLDTSFTHFRVYSILRSSLNGSVSSFLVAESEIISRDASVIDDGAHLVAEDPARLLYLGSQPVIAGTIEHKDQTLFLGDLSSVGRDYDALEELLQNNMFDLGSGSKFVPGETWRSKYVTFCYADEVGADNIPAVEDVGLYPYQSQLLYSSSQILTFKGGEKYRFALKFQLEDGTETDAFWIGDAENTLYPDTTTRSGEIRRVVARCDISPILSDLQSLDLHIRTVQLLIAEATYADRAVKAQGIINPTMFSVWERYNNRLYSVPSWLSRPRRSAYPYRHFDSVHRSDEPTGEIECAYWDEAEQSRAAYFRIMDYDTDHSTYTENFPGQQEYSLEMLIYGVIRQGTYPPDYAVSVYIVRASFTNKDMIDYVKGMYIHVPTSFETLPTGWERVSDREIMTVGNGFTIHEYLVKSSGRGYNLGKARYNAWVNISSALLKDYGITEDRAANEGTFRTWCDSVDTITNPSYTYYCTRFSTAASSSPEVAANQSPQADRWWDITERYAQSANAFFTPAYRKQHLMFVDENVITLNSPEIEQEAVSFDNASCKLRIIGAAKFSSVISDYTVDAEHGYLPGTNLYKESFSGRKDAGNTLQGVIAYPLWREFGLRSTDDSIPKDARTAANYEWDTPSVRYWLHMWQHSGKIHAFSSKDDENDYSYLHKKRFANLHFSNQTVYSGNIVFDQLDSLRVFNAVASQYTELNIGTGLVRKKNYYDGNFSLNLSVPGDMKYPVYYSKSSAEDRDYFLRSDNPVQLSVRTSPHAVVALPSWRSGDKYIQKILPSVYDTDIVSIPDAETIVDEHSDAHRVTGALVPWMESDYTNVLVLDPSIQIPVFSLVEYTGSTATMSFDDMGTHRDMPFYRIWVAAKSVMVNTAIYTRLSDGDYIYLIDISNYLDMPMSLDLVDAPVVSRVPIGDDDSTTVRAKITVASSPSPQDFVVSGFGLFNVLHGTFVTAEPYISYDVDQDSDNDLRSYIGPEDQYMFIGEIYQDYGSGSNDTRYGGIRLSDVQNNRFVAAGPRYSMEDLTPGFAYIIGDQGDTFFQRYDSMRVMPGTDGNVNEVTDIVSAMLETHINVDGRTDSLRGTSEIASIDPSSFGQINMAYSQQNNYVIRRDLDEDMNVDSYRSAITWTQEKHDQDLVDEWTHITLTSSLKLDADKGICRALRRFNNSLIAFQDRGIAEILYNSRTQLSTTSGAPVEIANSGKVDGKNYITNKNGCTNKWSISEGRAGLYFIDNISKSMCCLSGEGIEDLSSRFGFASWFRAHNSTEPWRPVDFNNFITFFDKAHADLYIVGDRSTAFDAPTLVYNESLGAFTSFFDYENVPMMANIGDRFVSFRDHKLWRQNEGAFCNFYDEQYPFWVKYRVTPDPYGDKVWTNVEYRADFYRILDGEDTDILPGTLTDDIGIYQPNETFTYMQFWNEYQATASEAEYREKPKKKFRLWRMAIPRAVRDGRNRYGLDRIRNPWLNLTFKKTYTGSNDETNQDLMQLHDITVMYFE